MITRTSQKDKHKTCTMEVGSGIASLRLTPFIIESCLSSRHQSCLLRNVDEYASISSEDTNLLPNSLKVCYCVMGSNKDDGTVLINLGRRRIVRKALHR